MEKKSYSFSVVLTPAEEGGFTVTVPSLHGCVTEGDTYEEALANAKEAIELTVECMTERGEEIPQEQAPLLVSVIQVADVQYA